MMVTVQWWVLPALVFCGVGMAAIIGGIVLAALTSREPKEEPAVVEVEPPMVIATGIDAYVGGLVQPEPPQIDREWRPWGMNWAGEETAFMPVIEAAPVPLAIEPTPVARERFPRLERHLVEQAKPKVKVTGTYKDYKRIEFEVAAA